MRVGLVDPAKGGKTGEGLLESSAVELERVDSAPAIVAKASELDYVVAVGDSALLSLFREDIEIPVLPVGSDAGLHSVPKSELGLALNSLGAGEDERVDSPTIDVKLGDRTFRALMDVMAVTAEPARISEYRTTHGTDGTVIDRVRADGIVVSGPAGTPGYATAVEGPILGPTVQGLAIVPVAPFRTEHPHWVLAPPIEIEVVREEVPVSLVLDDRAVTTVPAGESLSLTWGDPFEIVTLPQSESPLGVTRNAE